MDIVPKPGSCLDPTRRPLVIAHRGASQLVGEDNTLRSFRKAIEISADMVEFDVRLTSDSQIACFHDESVDGTPVSDLSLMDLSTRSGLDVPTLEDVVSLCRGRIQLDVEVKVGGFEEQIVATLLSSLPVSDFVIKSFSDDIVAKIHTINPAIATGLLIGELRAASPSMDALDQLTKRVDASHANFLAPHFSWIRDELFSHPDLSRVPIFCWTVNEPALIRRVTQHPIHAIITDRPDLAQQILGIC